MRLWGFDIGTTSIGFAVLDHEPGKESGKIIRLGVRIFPEGVEPVGSGKETAPRNRKRRQARMARRQTRRRRLRRRELTALLAEAGLLPAFASPEWNRLMGETDPYEFRKSALAGALAPHELGRALYHLVKRRGFKSSRIEDAEEAAENEGKTKKKTRKAKEEKPADAAGDAEDTARVKEAIGNLRVAMGEKTLGAHLVTLEKKRDRHIGRDMVEEEFDKIWTAQAARHPAILTEDLRERFRNIAFHQRPVFWRLKTLGKCALEPNEDSLCPKGSWLGQQFVMLQTLNSLRLAGGNARELTPDERAILLPVLSRQDSMYFGGIRRELKTHWADQGVPSDSKFNYEVSGSLEKIPGNAAEARLADIFGEGWDSHPARDRIRAELHKKLFHVDYRRIGNARIEIRGEGDARAERDRFVSWAQAEWTIAEEQARKLSDLTLPPGWLRHSAKAIRNMLPHLDARFSYREAMDKAYPGHERATGEIIDRLPSHPRSMPDIRNPTVHRALNELRKVVNNLLDAHGRPDTIRIELARDVKLAGKRKAEAIRKTKEREKERAKAAKDLAENDIADPSRDDIEKWLLWKESGETCPYTGRTIGFGDLFGGNVLYQIEHIFPRWRSLDNTFANKTLCDPDINRLKTNMTPFEFYNSVNRPDWADTWDKVKDRLDKAVRAGRFPASKARRFTRDKFMEADSDEFSERQLRDTAYIASAARDFLLRLFPESSLRAGGALPVETCNGRITAQLRRLWGLNKILSDDGEKNRADHRHHAVDAAAIALTSRAFVKRMADYYRQERTPEAKRFPLPWSTVRDDVIRAVENIVVSHRSSRKVSGPLHMETSLRDTGATQSKGRTEYRLYVKRKPLSALSAGESGNIRDPKIRELALARLKEHGGDVRKAFASPLELPCGTGGTRPVRKVRVLVKRQPHLMIPLNEKNKAWAEAGENHHMAIHRGADGRVDYDVVSRYEAARRVAAKKPVIERNPGDGRSFLFSLAPGDMLEFPNAGGRSDYRVVTSVWDNGQVVTTYHTDAGGAQKNDKEDKSDQKSEDTKRVKGAKDSKDRAWKPNPNSILKQDGRKISIDPIGRVRPSRE